MGEARLPARSTAAGELTAAQQARMVRALQATLAADSDSAVELIETHISFVLVAGARAYKLKKALKNAFLDDSTLALRRHACQEELRLNRRLAPELYLDVVPVTGSVQRPQFAGAGPTLDVAVQMRAFVQEGLWDRLAARGELGASQIDALVAQLGPFHDRAAVASASGRLGTAAQVRSPMLDNLRELATLWPAKRPGPAGSRPPAEALRELCAWEARTFERLQPVLARRLAEGRVRECHGDLHLGNVTQIDGRTTVFDAIEFNDEFRWVDVMSEVAFIAMDLHAHGLAGLAHRLVDGCLRHSGDYEGVRVLDYYRVHRALVRAKVALMRRVQHIGPPPARGGAPGPRERDAPAAHAGADAAARYLELALHFSREPRPVLMATHGFSGSGKSSLTQGLLEAAGAIRIRSDVERKRLAGLGALERSDSAIDAGLYREAMSEATYARLLRLAAPVLAGGWHAILDATFLRRSRRDAAREFAAALGVPFVLLDFEADLRTLRERLRSRAQHGADASEADERVLEWQVQSAQALQADERAVVFPVRSPPGAAPAGAPPQADWAPLLERLRSARAPGAA